MIQKLKSKFAKNNGGYEFKHSSIRNLVIDIFIKVMRVGLAQMFDLSVAGKVD